MNVQPAELVNFAEITEIELRVLRRMKDTLSAITAACSTVPAWIS